MFQKYGIIGLIMIIFVELNFLLVMEPFARWYFPIVWFGYIFVIDALNYKLDKTSLIKNRTKLFIGMVVLSAAFWWVFEFFNIFISNWSYHGLGGFATGFELRLFGTVSFATVVPAVFETAHLLASVHLFDHVNLKKRHRISKLLLNSMVGLGLLCFILIITFPNVFYPLIWLAFFLVLDPFNYLHGQPSIVGHLKDRKLRVPLALFIAGMVCGLLWEFWNFWAVAKWTYALPFLESVPILGTIKIFEMPIIGYIGYGPFAWELYAMYFFALILLRHERQGFIKI
jgi:hypothetical protein